ncbi:hypothetical protein EV182_001343 [Spiromyces aspiralis]|uniref:Uncharacterized protein n=1 Tax=Spiromyces aspiralis TaxID=68401 RepID=A0ACC1HJ40_9FUNG|nr:hypothetical protein EV182_001343 [Spiromyces aspiralis]
MKTRKDKLTSAPQEIEAQLRASTNAARSLVDSWLGGLDYHNDSSNSNQGEAASVLQSPKAKEIFKPRPARLGVGAKYLSHSQAIAAQTGGPALLTVGELKLKRRLEGRKKGKHDDRVTTSPSSSSGKGARAAGEGPNDDDSDDVQDSRTGSLLAKSRLPSSLAHSDASKKRGEAFLDTLLGKRKKRR